jgi:hypothetical protein
MCENNQRVPLFWGCPAPLATANYDIDNPPMMRAFTAINPVCDPQPFRIQGGAIAQPSRAPTLKPWRGQPIPARPISYINIATW